MAASHPSLEQQLSTPAAPQSPSCAALGVHPLSLPLQTLTSPLWIRLQPPDLTEDQLDFGKAGPCSGSLNPHIGSRVACPWGARAHSLQLCSESQGSPGTRPGPGAYVCLQLLGSGSAYPGARGWEPEEAVSRLVVSGESPAAHTPLDASCPLPLVKLTGTHTPPTPCRALCTDMQLALATQSRAHLLGSVAPRAQSGLAAAVKIPQASWSLRSSPWLLWVLLCPQTRVHTYVLPEACSLLLLWRFFLLALAVSHNPLPRAGLCRETPSCLAHGEDLPSTLSAGDGPFAGGPAGPKLGATGLGPVTGTGCSALTLAPAQQHLCLPRTCPPSPQRWGDRQGSGERLLQGAGHTSPTPRLL